MAFNYNHTVLMGRLTKDPESFAIAPDKTKTTFSVAIDRPYTKDNGDKDTDFLQVALWGKTAEMGAQLLYKGCPVLIWGSIRVRSYEKDGEKHWRTEIVADNFQRLQYPKPDGTDVSVPVEMAA